MKRRESKAMMLAFFLALGPCSSALAAQLVTFTRGQAIVVQSVEKRGSWYYFILDGGGEMGVPASRVARIEDYEIPPQSAAALAAPPAAPTSSVPNSPQAPVPMVAPGGGEAEIQGSLSTAPPQVPPSSGDPAGNVVTQGDDDWRYRVRMGGGPRMQSVGGGIRKAAGMGRPMGPGGMQGDNPNQNPFNRRPPLPPTPPQSKPQH